MTGLRFFASLPGMDVVAIVKRGHDSVALRVATSLSNVVVATSAADLRTIATVLTQAADYLEAPTGVRT